MHCARTLRAHSCNYNGPLLQKQQQQPHSALNKFDEVITTILRALRVQFCDSSHTRECRHIKKVKAQSWPLSLRVYIWHFQAFGAYDEAVCNINRSRRERGGSSSPGPPGTHPKSCLIKGSSRRCRRGRLGERLRRNILPRASNIAARGMLYDPSLLFLIIFPAPARERVWIWWDKRSGSQSSGFFNFFFFRFEWKKIDIQNLGKYLLYSINSCKFISHSIVPIQKTRTTLLPLRNAYTASACARPEPIMKRAN